MKVIVLAGGEGKRMWPIATDKCLIPFLGKSLLEHNLKKFQTAGFNDFVIIANPKSKDAVSQIAEGLGLNFKLSVQSKPKGMADAILSAKEFIEGEILIVNAEDILEPVVFEGVLKAGGDAAFAGLKVEKYFPGGYLKTEGGKVTGIAEKPGEGNEPSNMVKLVVDFFKDGKQLIQYLEQAKSGKDDVYEIALEQMIGDGMDIRFSKYSGVWLPLKYPWHILDIKNYFLSQLEQKISPSAKISEKAVIEDNVVIEDGARVFEGAVIKGPVFIGKNCIIGNNSLVRESNLEEGCVTGFSSDIVRSYIGPNSWFHTNYIGDSVLEGDFGMGSGAVLANLRLDGKTIRETGLTKHGLVAGKGVRMGVNSSTMPGVKVGRGSLIGPGVVLKKDLPENKIISVKEESYEIKEHESVPTSYDQFKDTLT